MPVPRAGVDDAVEQPESLLLELERRVVVLEMAVVERQPQRVQAERRQEARHPSSVKKTARKRSKNAVVALLAEDARAAPAAAATRCRGSR